jgi:ankyrin repeat protein
VPLHDAARSGYDGSFCRFLVGQWPESLRVRCHRGRLPLHDAASEGKLSTAQCLVELWPQSVSEKTLLGWLPLHLAVQYRPRVDTQATKAIDTARFLLHQLPHSVWEATDEGFLPLHIASGMGEFPDGVGHHSAVRRMERGIVRLLVEADRRLVRTPSREGLLPLHYALRGGLSVDPVEILGQEWPESLLFWNAEGRSALHMALARERPLSGLVPWLVEQHPELLHGADRNGRLPLHTAAVSNQPLEVVQFIAAQLPMAVAHKDRHGSLPLHLAAQTARSVAVVEFLVGLRPESVGDRDHSGSLPLHEAAGFASSLEMVRFLVERRPESVNEKDRSGSLPLHRAVARWNSSLDVVRFLVEQRPPSVEPVDGAGMRPIHVAAIHGAPLDVVFFLMLTDPESIYKRALRLSVAREPSRRRPVSASELKEGHMLSGLSFPSE